MTTISTLDMKCFGFLDSLTLFVGSADEKDKVLRRDCTNSLKKENIQAG
jgi:hypothetical protein